MNQLRYSAVGLAAALACHAALAQATPPNAPEATLPSISVKAQGDHENWQTLREKESRVRPIGAAPERTTLDTNTAQHATVIDADELNRISALNTLDVLERAPGVTVNRTGGLDGTIVLRGQNSNSFRVPMFIDGDRFRGRPAFQFMMVSPAELEQVELIRGPASVRYGSDGMSGLVNFVTKKPKGTLGEQFTFQGGEADVTYRSNGNALQSNVSMEAAGNQFDLRVYGSARNAGNYDSPLGEVRNTDYQTTSGGIALGYMPNAQERYELSYRYGAIKDGSANATTTATNFSRREPLTIHQLRLGYEGHFSDSWVRRVKASLYGNAFDSMLDSYSQKDNKNTLATSHIRGPNIVGGSISFELPTVHDIDTKFGMEFAHDRWLGNESASVVTNATTGAPISNSALKRSGRSMTQSNFGSFVLSEWKVTPRWKLTGGARWDYYLTDTEVNFYNNNQTLRQALEAGRNTSTTALTGSIGSSYFVTDTVEVTGSYGSGFHMPWHSEMFNASYSDGKYTIPNPALKPEYATTAEIGTRLHLDNAYVDVSAYRTMYRDYIGTAKSTTDTLNDTTQNINIGKVRVQGIDASAKWQLNDHWNLHGNIAYVHGTDRITDKPLEGLAPWTGAVGAQYVGAGNAWAVTGEVQFAKGQTHYNASKEHPTAGYGVVNLYGQLQLDKLGFGGKNTQLVMGVTNLFDTTYRSASTSSVPTSAFSQLNPLVNPGRSVNLTLRTKF